ncbi:MAG: AAA family ATPase [Bacilli bacterium]|nr:AAA family ATPase [Bacilli bacterium]MDD4607940.1 AAA family ATPase [Bacilli bacterium]
MNNNIEIIDFDSGNEKVKTSDNLVIPEPLPSNLKILRMYGEDLTAKEYITNPAIARDSEIKKLIIVLLTPEKSGLLIGKPGIGKTAIVEGLAYLIQRNEVPNALKGYRIIKVGSNALIGKTNVDGKEEMIITSLVDELKTLNKTIVFIDEIHTLIGGTGDGPMDLANILKPALDRGDVKAIGATTTIEYETYIVRDRAFLRRFDRIDVLEPDEATTVKILMGSLPKIEKKTGIKFKYNNYIAEKLVAAIVRATSEFKRVYGLAAMYPDVAFSVLTQAFSHALFGNKNEVNVEDVYDAIKNSKRIYPDSIVKELTSFREEFKDECAEEKIVLPVVKLEDIQNNEENY